MVANSVGVGDSSMYDAKLVSMAIAVVVGSGDSACAMEHDAEQHPCRVVGGELLDPASGGGEAMCAAIVKAVSGAEEAASVEVTILDASRARAIVTTASGRQLPAVNVASSDGKLSQRSFDMLAGGIAAQLSSEPGK